MKKLMILSVAFLFSIPFVFGQVVENEKELIKETKEEIKEEKEDVKFLEKQLNSVEKELKHLEGDDVSYQAKQSFIADFGDIPDVKWERVDSYDVAEFTKDGKVMKAYYNFYANLIGTTHYVTFADLPENAQEKIKNDYADYNIGPVVYFDNNNSDESAVDLVLLYGIQFESQDNYFVELTKGTEKFVLQVLDSGEVFFFKDLD